MKKDSYKLKLLPLILAAALTLSGCDGNSGDTWTGGTSSGAASEAVTVTEGETEAETETETETETEEIPKTIEELLPDKVTVIDAENHMVDITPLLPAVEGMDFSDYILESRESVLLLYEDNRPQDEENAGDMSYSIYRMKLTDGSTETVVEKLPIINSREEGHHQCYLVQADPVIIYNVLDESFGFPDSKQFWHPEMDEDVYVSDYFTADGELYVTDTLSNIFRVVRNGSEYGLKKIWTCPAAIAACTLVEITDSDIVLRGRNVLEEGNVYLRIEVPSGKAVETYTGAETEDDYRMGVYGGISVTLPYGDERGLILQKDDMTYTCSFKGNDPFSLAVKEERSMIMFSRFPVADNIFMFRGMWDGEDGQESRLMLWDYSKVEGESYEETAHKAYTIPEITAAANKKREEAIEKKFGVSIYTGDEAKLEYVGYTAGPVYDELTIAKSLYRIDNVFNTYPGHFFTQLSGDGSPVNIYLVMHIGGEGSENLSSAGGLQWEDEDGVCIAFATEYDLDKATIYHEVTHAVYRKLQDDGFLYDGTDEWMALNPPDFEYVLTYNEDELPDDSYTAEGYWDGGDPEKVYFIKPYDKTYQTEDVADLFAQLMCDDKAPDYYKSSHLQAKCVFFFELIRKGFDTAGWPAKTSWEKRMEEIGK